MTEATDYRPMWAKLGLDLEKHDALLGVLGQAYQDISAGSERIAQRSLNQTSGEL